MHREKASPTLCAIFVEYLLWNIWRPNHDPYTQYALKGLSTLFRDRYTTLLSTMLGALIFHAENGIANPDIIFDGCRVVQHGLH